MIEDIPRSKVPIRFSEKSLFSKQKHMIQKSSNTKKKKTREQQAEKLFFQTHEPTRTDYRKSFLQTNATERRHVRRPIAQLVERRTVNEDILRSLVRVRVGRVFLCA